MSTDEDMTIVTALIRPHMESHVVQALHDLPDFPGFFISEARGQGRGRGAGGSYSPSESDLSYHRFLQLQMVCPASAADRICGIIATAAWTGRKGDGVIFTSPAHSFARIRELKPVRQESAP
jgi:nitrogen regulatory protein PII